MVCTAYALDFPQQFAQGREVPGEPQLVGRKTEFERLTEHLTGAGRGAGRLVFLAGDPGLGKSRLAEEVARVAEQRDCTVVWGRCWEAGGAPAYWPWRQALTGLSRALDSDPWARNQVVSSFMAGGVGAQEAAAELAGLEPEQARFLLMEAVHTTLAEAAQSRPLVVILEDVHVADSASLSLLEFLEPHVRQSRVLVVATYRPAELDHAKVSLRRTLQRVENIFLHPFALEEVREYLVRQVQTPLTADTIRDVALATEGNPLFLQEVTRVLRRQPDASRTAMLTQNIYHLIQQRLSTHQSEDVSLLEAASVVGRDFTLAALKGLTESSEAALEQALERLVQGAALERVELHSYRFSHILIREALYHHLDTDRRRELHVRRASELRALCEDGESSLWSEVAHHFMAALAVPDAILALERAAKLALSQLAFDDAVSLVEKAVASLPATVEPRRKAELLLLMAHARLKSGAVTSGRAACYEVARIAEQTGDAALLAKAALESGSVYVFAKVDKRLVTLLQDALRALPETEVAQKAEVSARLASALQPSSDPEQPFALAREAIRLARTQNDDALMLRVLCSAVSALMDLGPATERLPLNREYALRAEKLKLPSHLWRARCRLVFDHFELGQIDGAYENLSDVVALAERLDHPDYLWRATAMRAMTATFRGRTSEAHALLEETAAIASRTRDPNWPRSQCTLRLAWYRAMGQRLSEELVEQISEQFRGETFGDFYIWSDWARFGQVDQLRGAVDQERLDEALNSGDCSLLQDACFVTIALREQALLHRAYDAALPHAARFVSGGMTALTWEPPLSRVLGLIALALGRTEQGLEHLKAALDATQRAGSRCYAVWIQLDLAKALIDSDARERGLVTLEAASQCAQAIGLNLALGAVDKLRAALPGTEGHPPFSHVLPTNRSSNRLRLQPEGELWCLRSGEQTHRLPNTKGIRLLAELVAQPGREFHVLDLEKQTRLDASRPQWGNPESRADGGTAGAALDDTARRQYRDRIQDLQSEIQQAEDFHDTARASTLKAELDALTRELSRAFGLGGRARPVASAVERARINVQRRLKDSIKRVRAASPELAKQLERAIRTGTYCVYEP